jgi:hypothetical protein
LVDGFLNGRLKVGKRRLILAVKRSPLDELPQPFDQIQVGRVRWQKQKRDSQFARQRLHERVPLVTGVIQHHCDRADQVLRSDLPQQLAHRVGIHHGCVGHIDQFSRHGVPSPQFVKSLSSRRSPHPKPHERPHAAQKGSKNEMSRIHKKDVAISALCLRARRCPVLADSSSIDRISVPMWAIRTGLIWSITCRIGIGCTEP